MSTPYDIVERIIREGRYSPPRKRRCKRPRWNLCPFHRGWAILHARTWDGDRIYAVLNPKEVQAWKTVFRCFRYAALTEEGR
jgi:hypothetical protein